ncbi:hypothetical protein [Acinetobacter sp.]|uniref:hypothetical protein n=1 Tax=Acinetobacter sp. TaxID=472 RepID=UPI00388E6103
MSMLSNFQSDPMAILARSKMRDLPEDFMIYAFEWLGDIINDRASCVLKMTGAVFREAKRGPRKGQKCMMVKGTERMVFLTPDEVNTLK